MARTLSDDEEAALAKLLATWYGLNEARAWGSLRLDRNPDDPSAHYRVLSDTDWQRLLYAVEEFAQLWER